MQTKEDLLMLTDRWADWEASCAIAQTNSAPPDTVNTIAIDAHPNGRSL